MPERTSQIEIGGKSLKDNNNCAPAALAKCDDTLVSMVQFVKEQGFSFTLHLPTDRIPTASDVVDGQKINIEGGVIHE